MIPHSRPWITRQDNEHVQGVLTSGMIAHGTKVVELERSIAELTQTAGVVATSSGRSALSLALKTLEVKPQSKVILPTYVCPSVLNAVLNHSACPVVCDIGDNWVITPEQLAPHIEQNVSAILAVHTFGFPADINAIKQYRIPVIEDACQAFGVPIKNGGIAGSQGDVGLFSFSATKCLTTGEGGALVCNSSAILEVARRHKFDVGLTDMQAALGLSQLSRYSEFKQRRVEIRNRYIHALNGCKGIHIPESTLPFTYRFVVTLTDGQSFEEVQQAFAREGVAVRKGVDQMLHRKMGLADEDFPNACRLFDTTVSLPYYPAMTDEEVTQVISAVLKVFRS